MGSANASFLGDIGDWVSGAVEHTVNDIGKEAEKAYNKSTCSYQNLCKDRPWQ
jgi:hypothetical protein